MILSALSGIFLAAPAAFQPHLNQISLGLIGLVFFLQGARLAQGSLRAAIVHWSVQARILGFSFGIFPIVGLTILVIARPLGLLVGMSPNLELGFILLCCIPSTVQSSVTMTSIARGNMAVAITSSALSSLVGLIMSPLLLWIVAYAGVFKVHAAFGPAEMTDILKQLILELLLPFAIGRLLSKKIGHYLRHLSWLGIWDQASILIMVYSIFCEATHSGLWSTLSITSIFILVGMELTLLGSILCLSWWASSIGSLSYATRIAVQFCASKKALSFAIPLIAVIVASDKQLNAGALLIPTMLYHQMQLFVASFLANHYARRPADTE